MRVQSQPPPLRHQSVQKWPQQRGRHNSKAHAPDQRTLANKSQSCREGAVCSPSTPATTVANERPPSSAQTAAQAARAMSGSPPSATLPLVSATPACTPAAWGATSSHDACRARRKSGASLMAASRHRQHIASAFVTEAAGRVPTEAGFAVSRLDIVPTQCRWVKTRVGTGNTLGLRVGSIRNLPRSPQIGRHRVQFGRCCLTSGGNRVRSGRISSTLVEIDKPGQLRPELAEMVPELAPTSPRSTDFGSKIDLIFAPRKYAC